MGLAELLQSKTRQNSEEDKVKWARAYVRVSHENSAEKNISPATQRLSIMQYAEKNGYRIKEWYVDLAKSAFKKEAARTEFLRMLEDAKADPETTAIIAFRYDRFSRSASAPAQQAELLRHGVRIESAEEGYYDPETETGAIMSNLGWGLNRVYSIKLRNIVIPNMVVNFEQRDPDTGWAYKNGGRPMWGYKTHRIKVGRSAKYTDLHKAIWVLDDTVVAGKQIWEWARTVLLDWRLEKRMGYRLIADRLTKLGIPTPTGKAGWSASSVYSLVADWDKLYQYAGYAFWNRRNCQTGTMVDRDTSEWQVVADAHPAIITEDECEALYAMTEHNTVKQPYNKQKSRFSLSGGTIECAHCRSNYAGAKRHGDDYYVCGAHLYRRGEGCGTAWYIKKGDLEGLVFGKMLQLAYECKIDKWVETYNAAIDAEWVAIRAGSDARRRDIAILEEQLTNLTEVAAAGGNAPEVAERIRKTNDALEKLRRLENLDKPPKATVSYIKENVAEIETAFASADPEVRKLVMKSYEVAIAVDPELRVVDITITDPRYPPKATGEPDPIDSDSPVYRPMVGRFASLRN